VDAVGDAESHDAVDADGDEEEDGDREGEQELVGEAAVRITRSIERAFDCAIGMCRVASSVTSPCLAVWTTPTIASTVSCFWRRSAGSPLARRRLAPFDPEDFRRC